MDYTERFFMIRIFLLFLSLPLFGEVYQGPTSLHLRLYDALEIQGDATLKLVRAKSLQVNGSLQFHSLDVSGDAVVEGSFKGDKGKFGSLKVTGPATVSSLIVKQQADFDGPLEATHSQFQTLSVKADKIVLDEVILDNLTILKSSGPQVLILKGASSISGDIVFESGNGKLEIQGSEVHIGGTVQGASK